MPTSIHDGNSNGTIIKQQLRHVILGDHREKARATYV